jgi:hypothetical protein
VVEPHSPEAWHARRDAERASKDQSEAHMKRIREILGTEPVHRRLSAEEQRGGVKLSKEEVALRREVDEELRARKVARQERLRRAVTT